MRLHSSTTRFKKDIYSYCSNSICFFMYALIAANAHVANNAKLIGPPASCYNFPLGVATQTRLLQQQ